MTRVTRGFKARRRRKQVLKLASGQIGTRNRLFKTAIESVERGLVYAYRDRRVKKRSFRKLWISRLNAAARINGINYSTLMAKLKENNVIINRRVLSELTVCDPSAFSAMLSQIHAI